ncbi:MAG: HP0268 family nuclease [Campylobacterota bacterium]
MELLLARAEKDKKPKKVELESIDLSNNIFYFDRENSHKDMVKMVEYFEDKGLSVYLKEVKFGLDEEDYMYEVHIM